MARPARATPPAPPGLLVAGGRIRWERLGRMALLAVLGVILLLYFSPAKHWFEQRQTAQHQDQELQDLKRDHSALERQLRDLQGAGALEREARRLGMVRAGERAYSIENLPHR